MSPIRAVIGNRNFRNLWLGQIFSQVGVNILAFALIITVYARTSSNTAVSILVMTIGLPALLFAVVAGVFVDHWRKERVLFWCNILRAFFIVFLLFWHDNLFTVYLISILISTITQFFVPAEVPLIPLILPREHLFSANSIFTFTFYIATSVGFILSGPLLSTFGEINTYLIVAGFLLIASYFVAKIRLVSQEVKAVPVQNIFAQSVKELREGLGFIKRTKEVSEAIMLFAAAQAIVTILAALAPGFADRVLAIPLTDATLIVMAPAVAGVVVSSLVLAWYGKRIAPITQRVINSGIIGSSVVLLFLALFVRIGNTPKLLLQMERIVPDALTINRLEVAVFLFFLFGIFNAFVAVPVNTLLQEKTTDEIRGRVYGVVSAFAGGASVLPVVGAGQLADRVGVGKTIFVLCIATFLFGLYRVGRKTYN